MTYSGEQEIHPPLEPAHGTTRHWPEIGPIRPPSEGRDRSLLVRVTRNCAWNRCAFCATYRGQRFGYRTVAEIREDIDAMRAMAGELKTTSFRLGRGGTIDNAVLGAVVNSSYESQRRSSEAPERLAMGLNSLSNVANWLASGGRTTFLQDADALIMRVPELVEVITYLKQAFPGIGRVTSYARAGTLSRRSVEELGLLRSAGLSRLHVGLESGSDEVLRYMQKGVTSEEHIAAGRAVMASGISLSEYMMPGLGGKKLSETHALETARVLNDISPEFIRLRSLIVRKGTPLHERAQTGDFQALEDDETVAEIGLFLEGLNCNSYVVSDQMSNLLWEVEGQLPQDKEALLRTVNSFLKKTSTEKLKFILDRRLDSYLALYGAPGEAIKTLVEQAEMALRTESSGAKAKVVAAVAALKQGYV